MSKSDQQGRSALVTGASKGIGRAIALELAEMGVKVAVNYNTSAESAESVASAIKERGGEAFPIQADVSVLDQVVAMVDKVNDTWGHIDILVNNAGIIHDGLLVRMSDEAWDSVIATNLNGTFYCTRAVLRKMLPTEVGTDNQHRLGGGHEGKRGTGELRRLKGRHYGASRRPWRRRSQLETSR